MDYGYYNMDCLQGMKEFPDKYFDLAIVDPPYGIGEGGEKNKTRGKLAKSKDYSNFAGQDLEPPSQEYFEELFRVSKNQIIFGANHFISRIPIDSHCWIVWNKKTVTQTSLIVNWHGPALIVQSDCLNTGGKVFYRKI